MTYSQEQFNRLSQDDQNILLEFLESLTDGEIRSICRGQLMSKKEINEICDALDRFKYGQGEEFTEEESTAIENGLMIPA